MSQFTVALVLTLALSQSACHLRRPLETIPPPPATRLVAQLTDSGTVAMGNALGAGALEVEGVVAAATESEWTLQMLRVDHRDGRSIGWNREPVKFRRELLVDPHTVVLDKRRSWLAAGGITVGAFLLARAFGLLGADEPDDGEIPPPQESVIGILRR